MIYPDIPAKRWSEKFNVPIQEAKCPACKQSFMMDRPFIFNSLTEGHGRMAGFTMQDHGCGPNLPSIMTAIDPEGQAFWRSIFE